MEIAGSHHINVRSAPAAAAASHWENASFADPAEVVHSSAVACTVSNMHAAKSLQTMLRRRRTASAPADDGEVNLARIKRHKDEGATGTSTAIHSNASLFEANRISFGTETLSTASINPIDTSMTGAAVASSAVGSSSLAEGAAAGQREATHRETVNDAGIINGAIAGTKQKELESQIACCKGQKEAAGGLPADAAVQQLMHFIRHDRPEGSLPAPAPPLPATVQPPEQAGRGGSFSQQLLAEAYRPQQHESPQQLQQLQRHHAACHQLLQQEWARDTRLLFLGTGCAEPSKYRNGSCILLQLSCGGALMMDCGEGTWGQMVRAMGREGATQQVRRLAYHSVTLNHSAVALCKC